MPILTRRNLLGLALLASATAQAQDYPTRPIKWIVPYLAGTSPDLTTRLVGEVMSDLLKQPIVVENKAGVAGNLGAMAAAKSAPDGYTWVYSGSPMANSMRMYRKPGFDAFKDFVHIGRIGTSELTVVTSPATGIQSVQDLLDRARKSPGTLTYASGGIGSPAHMASELLLQTAKAGALHVPYKGASESVNAVMGKQVDFAVTVTSVSLPHVKSGKLAPLAVTGSARNPLMPGVPTLTESGVGVTLTSFGGLSVPAGTPRAITQRIGEALQQALARPELIHKLESLGGRVTPSTPQDYLDALRAEVDQTEQMMKFAKVEAQ
ncbi:tripartite tricarboxylate transporter substrate binding protein [Curvibacter sp. HBC61]|uniref:Tripartite tricarboxylate transporter substrate binding protein n=1 Tax=Curvibacter cyanobacteriorum TaxID=3026422 RepID=A0ABT5MWH9_9BURK|nr:tripartite tricarboxylate transporter substrate binding protein [Curvibacter sp. HBC61]MDD0838413.1 tripartite tricarboxylate transporter substrate binding protein [Curvibacter sp. HBC61]